MEYQTTNSNNSTLPEEKQNNEPPLYYKRIGGFLIVIAIGLILSFIQNLTYFMRVLEPITQKYKWDMLTNPTSATYHPYLKPLLIFELISSALILILNLFALVVFFQKKRIFPAIIIAFIINIFILRFIGYYYSGFIPDIANSATYAKDGEHAIVRFLSMGIWIPYFLFSERVKRTFVR